MESTIISMKNLSCKSGRSYLLQNINWQVKKGEHWVVFGLNGSGKTTLLSIVTGFQKYTHGQLEVFGEPYSRENILEHRKKIGWVSNSFFDKCFHNEQVLAIVLSGLTGTLNIDGTLTDADIVRAQNLLEQLGIRHKQDMLFSFLSKGERQNVLLARAMIADPDILILDEPGTGLDVLAREKMLTMVAQLANTTDKTIIYVTHYLEEILPSFDYCLLLQKGCVYKMGKTEKVLTQEELANFFGQPVCLQEKENHYRYIQL